MRRSESKLPKVKLMAVATLSGVSAEPILLFPNGAASADMRDWGKTSPHPSQQIDQANPGENAAHHMAQLRSVMQEIAPQRSTLQEMAIQKQNLEQVAREQTQEVQRTDSRIYQPERETDYER